MLDVQPIVQKWAIHFTLVLLLSLVVGAAWVNLYLTEKNSNFQSWLNKKEAILRRLI